MIYVPRATDYTGDKYVYDTHMAKIVFFCPKPCPPPTRSPYAAPILFPMKNCNAQAARLTPDNAHFSRTPTGLSARKRHVYPTDSTNPKPHR